MIKLTSLITESNSWQKKALARALYDVLNIKGITVGEAHKMIVDSVDDVMDNGVDKKNREIFKHNLKSKLR